jgi:hypothetical protein
MAILFGTTGDGTTLPVLVDQFGNLLAKGIPGDEGPPGPPGGSFALPPDPVDGDVLGWENGQLVWVSEPIPPVNPSIFTPVLYTGNAGTQSITGLGFSPDLVWIKSVDATYDHALFDTVRGALNRIRSNTTSAEGTDTATLTSFDTDGFTIGSDDVVNKSSEDYIAWCWDAGDTTVTNNDGSIESQVRSNDNFSVVSFVSAGTNGGNFSVGHGLSNKPDFALVKTTGAASDWTVYHASVCDNTSKYLVLNSSDGLRNYPVWGDNLPTSSVLGLTSGGAVNVNQTCIAYCWAETSGVSSFGSYTGASNLKITTGFKPAFVMIKCSSDSGFDWVIVDSARGNEADGVSNKLYPNTANKENDNSDRS